MTIEIVARDERSWRTWAFQSTLHAVRARYLFSSQRAEAAQPQVDGSPKLPVPSFGMRGCKVVPRIVDDIHVYDFVAAKSSSATTANGSTTTKAPHKRIYFFAGGAFKFQASAFHFQFCAALADRLPNTSVTVISYPLAPRNPAPKSFPATQKVAQTLLAESRDKKETVIYVGDSAGGNMVLSLVLASLAENPQALAPSVIMAMSPAVNLLHDNPKVLELAAYDCLLTNPFCHKASDDWAGAWKKDDPRISPFHADLSVFAKRGITVHGLIGGYDVLSPDEKVFVQKLQDAGVSGKWLIWEKQIHDFPLTATFGLPESVEGLKWVLKVLREV